MNDSFVVDIVGEVLKHLPGKHDQKSHSGVVVRNYNDTEAEQRAEIVMEAYGNKKLEKLGFFKRTPGTKFREIESIAQTIFSGKAGLKLTTNKRYRWSDYPDAAWLLDMHTGIEYVFDHYEPVYTMRGSGGKTEYIVRFIKQNAVSKHLPGKHNQADHAGQRGARGGGDVSDGGGQTLCDLR